MNQGANRGMLPHVGYMRDVWTHLIRIEAGRAKREVINKELRKHKVKLKVTKREQYIENAQKNAEFILSIRTIKPYSEQENEWRKPQYIDVCRIQVQPDTIQYAKDLWIDHNKMLINEHCSAIERWDQI